MAKKKHNAIGMKNIFEEAQREIEHEMNAQIAEKEQEIFNMQPNIDKYDHGQGDIEDRNEEISIRMEIDALKSIRDKRIAELETKAK